MGCLDRHAWCIDPIVPRAIGCRESFGFRQMEQGMLPARGRGPPFLPPGRRRQVAYTLHNGVDDYVSGIFEPLSPSPIVKTDPDQHRKLSEA